MAMGEQQRQHHVVAVAAPAQGHLNPVMRFCKLLAKQDGFIVTFVDFDQTQKLQIAAAEDNPKSQQEPSAAPPHPLVRRARISVPGLDLSNGFSLSFHDFFQALLSVAPDLEQLILSLNAQGPRVTCLLSDFNITLPTQDVADKLSIPRIVLYPCSASRLLFTHYLSQGELVSLEEVKEASVTSEQGRKLFRELPGLPTLYNTDIPHFKHVTDETVPLWTNSIKSWQVCDTRAHAVVVNSFEDLEASTFATLSKCCKVPIYDVGFWVEPLLRESATSLWKEDKGCMSWLDQQPALSVLYISFGSITLLSKCQYEEFLNGLLSSQQRFLWVLRPGLVENLDYTSSVADIVSKSHGRGLVINWAQLQVLVHPSVGGFLTHCGWNSTSESIASGVPMLCWPYFADQPLNARCVVDEWKVGLSMECSKEDGCLIKRDEIEKVIRALMEGLEGKHVRENMKKLKERSDQCFLENGSSYKKLKALIEGLDRSHAELD
ncbi:hypothetical protein L7F22_046311 [Adiantum nelumboides]|nr:hypothetical protein [Adiantum nelumboides]